MIMGRGVEANNKTILSNTKNQFSKTNAKRFFLFFNVQAESF